MFKKKSWDKPFSEKVARRVGKIATADLAQWSDQALFELGRTLSMYEKTREDIYLDDALLSAEALHAVINEYHRRVNSTK
jgi:hypothetical protein